MAVDQFYVPGIAGDRSVRAISAELSRLPGVRLVLVDLATHSVRVEHNGSVDTTALIQAIKQAGYAEVATLI